MSLFQPGDQAPGAALAGRRVMVVEDEYFLADDIRRKLDDLGVRIVGPVADIRDATRLLQKEKVDAAVLDVNVASEMVFPLARALRSRNVPFLFTTGYDRSILAPEFDDVQLLVKPLDLEVLVRELTNLVRRN